MRLANVDLWSGGEYSRRVPRGKKPPPGRRAATRVPHAAMITYRLGGQEYANLSADISADGIFIRTFVPPQVGTIIEVEMELAPQAGGGRFAIEGEVVRVVVDDPDPRQNGMGLRFHSVRTADALSVRRLIAYLFSLEEEGL